MLLSVGQTDICIITLFSFTLFYETPRAHLIIGSPSQDVVSAIDHTQCSAPMVPLVSHFPKGYFLIKQIWHCKSVLNKSYYKNDTFQLASVHTPWCWNLSRHLLYSRISNVIMPISAVHASNLPSIHTWSYLRILVLQVSQYTLDCSLHGGPTLLCDTLENWMKLWQTLRFNV